MQKSYCNFGEFVVKFTSQRIEKLAGYRKWKKLGKTLDKYPGL